MTYEEYCELIDEYVETVVRKFEMGRLSQKQFTKSLSKLEQWEDQFVQKYNIDFDEEEDWEGEYD